MTFSTTMVSFLSWVMPGQPASPAQQTAKPAELTLEEMLDPNKPSTVLGTCQDPGWGVNVTLKGKTGQKISTAVTVFYEACESNDTKKCKVAGYYTGFTKYVSTFDHSEVTGIFFDKTGLPIATLGKPGESITDRTFIDIYDYNIPGKKIGTLEARGSDLSFGRGEEKSLPKIRVFQYIINDKDHRELLRSADFISDKAFNIIRGYDPSRLDFFGAIAEVKGDKIISLLGLIDRGCK